MKKWETSFVALLSEYGTEFVSGEELAERLGCSRAAVWKKVANLRKEGYPIEAVTNRGIASIENTSTVLFLRFVVRSFLGYLLRSFCRQ